MSTLKRLHSQVRARRQGKPAFTLLELIVVLLVLGILAAIAVPTFNRVKENSAVRAAQTTLEAAARNGEAIAASDRDASDEDIAAAVEVEFTDTAMLTVSVGTGADADKVTVTQTSGSITASGSVEFNGGVATITAATVGSGGSSSTTSTTVALSLSYASTTFSTTQTAQTNSPNVSGGTASSFSYTGTLPDGVSFDTSTGVFTGPSVWNFSVAKIASGDSHTCAVTTTGSVKCWGYNFGYPDLVVPTDVAGLTSGVATIDAGRHFTCAVTTTGGAKCWGNNNSGQLGDGTTNFSLTPVDVTGLTSGVASIATDNQTACALTTSGGVKCWGFNNAGQLGDGTTTDSSTPVDVSGLTSGVAAVTVGHSHACAVTTTGGAKCWGSNYGALGDGTSTSRLTPVDVSGLTSGVASIDAGGGHTCAVTTTGGAKCWGWNGEGELGDGTTTTRLAPVDVSGLTSGVASIDAGREHSCAVTTSGAAKCWGRNTSGQLGDGTTTDRLTPVDVSGLTSGVASISGSSNTSGYHTCAVTTTGGAYCWSWNGKGQLGDGTKTQRIVPTAVNNVGPLSGWPAAITVTVTSSTGETADASITLTNS